MRTAATLACALLMGSAVFAAEETIEKKLELAAGGKLEVANVGGKIELSGKEGRAVSIRAVKRSKGDGADLAKVEVRIQSEAAGIRIETLYSNESAWEKLKSLFSGGSLVPVEVDYTITLPRDAAITASSVSGSILLTDTKAPLTLNTVSGQISVRQATGGGKANTVSGAVDVRTVSTGADAGEWKINTTSGDVTLELGAPDFKGASVQTVSGDTSVSLPKGTKAEVDFNSVSGKAEGASALERGGPAIKVNSVSGDLKVSVSP